MSAFTFEFISTIDAVSIAISVLDLIEIPKLASAKAGESLIPSSTIATTSPYICKRLAQSTFSSGRYSENTLDAWIPTFFAITLAVSALLPVSEIRLGRKEIWRKNFRLKLGLS